MEVAHLIVSPNQTAFMKGRVISDNILLADEMLHGFGRIRTPTICMLSLDLRKAFDAVRWDAILENLRAMGFSPHFIALIKNGIQTPTFSVLVEGTPTKTFKSQRVLR